MRVLISAYACEPDKGSEPAVGWGIACAMARRHDVWVLTRANNRRAIEASLARGAMPGAEPGAGPARDGSGPPPRFAYYDLPTWCRWWKRGGRGLRLYYYLWQLGALRVARRLHRERPFDLIHHVTFVKYWTPSFGALMPAPLVWGPLGGGDSTPRAFLRGLGWSGWTYELVRDVARRLGELDPLVRLTARRSSVALAATEATESRLRRLGARRVERLSQVALTEDELGHLAAPPPATGPIRLLSVGNLLHLKGFHLGLEAFARAGLEDCEYWLVGDGPERGRLERRARRLGITGRVRFLGRLTRDETLATMRRCHVLVHPSLHDSGGLACAEAMAAARPVICFDLGGPAEQVRPETGVRVPAVTPEAAVPALAEAMRRLARSPGERERLGAAARRRAERELVWGRRAERLDAAYRAAVAG